MSEVIEIAMVRQRVGWGARVVLDGEPEPEPGPRPPVVARTLALAHRLQAMIDRGEVRDQAQLADVTGFTRARITQILDLTLLAPDIQERILFAEETERRDIVCERNLRRVVRTRRWSEQRRRWAQLQAGPDAAGHSSSGVRQRPK